MTREEQIVGAAKAKEKETEFCELVKSRVSRGVDSAFGIGFIEGAVWADAWWRKRISSIDLSCYGRLHNIWHGIKQRCNNPKATGYKYYGGKGIKICKEWDTFIPFAIWAVFNGYDDNLTIDRIDSNGNYSQSNCRWVDYKTQGNNTSRNHFVEGKTISQHADSGSMNYRTMHNRIVRSGMSVEDALQAPPYNPKKVYQYDMDDNFIAEYPSARTACFVITGKTGHRGHIDDVCRGKRNSAYGYKWKYEKI